MRALCIAIALLLSPAPSRAEGSVRILTWNIQYGAGDLRAVGELLSRSKADIIALQEVDRRSARSGRVDQLRFIAKKVGYKAFFCAHQKRRTGVALLTRLPLRSMSCQSAKTSRLRFLLAELKVGSETLRVLSVHFHSTHPFDGAARRKHFDRLRLDDAKAALKVALARDGPTVVLGDFNDDSGSRPYRLFARRFTDACKAAGSFYEKTWPSTLPLTRIDYIWASKQLRVLRCRTLASHASDHRPVLAVLRHR